jgi:Ca2+/H+ antiporter, TMEM165/GDT1 family
MVSSFFLSFGVIFVAELGDKSQLMAMAFAARYKALPVLIGISIATAGLMQ